MSEIKTINLDLLPPRIRTFVDSVINICRLNDVDFEMSTESQVCYPGQNSECSGYFSEEPKQLMCGCGGPIEEWLPILVHESCHMDQWLEKDPIWDCGKINDSIEASEVIELWLEHKIELTNNQITEYINAVRDNELDCERRSVKKIKELNLPVDIDVYIKKANSYALFYNLLPIVRCWETLQDAQEDRYWEKMPHVLHDDHYYQLKSFTKINDWIWDEPYIYFKELLISPKTV